MKINTGYMSKIKTNLENRNCMYTHNIKFLNNIIIMKNVEKETFIIKRILDKFSKIRNIYNDRLQLYLQNLP